jgi:hypothetical protein
MGPSPALTNCLAATVIAFSSLAIAGQEPLFRAL